MTGLNGPSLGYVLGAVVVRDHVSATPADGKPIAMAMSGSPADKGHAIMANSIALPPADQTFIEPDCLR